MTDYKAISESVDTKYSSPQFKMGLHCNLEYCSIWFNCFSSLGVIALIVFMFGSSAWCADTDDAWCDAFGGPLGILYCFLLLIGMYYY